MCSVSVWLQEALTNCSSRFLVAVIKKPNKTIWGKELILAHSSRLQPIMVEKYGSGDLKQRTVDACGCLALSLGLYHLRSQSGKSAIHSGQLSPPRQTKYPPPTHTTETNYRDHPSQVCPDLLVILDPVKQIVLTPIKATDSSGSVSDSPLPFPSSPLPFLFPVLRLSRMAVAFHWAGSTKLKIKL